jgi:hypothetical protein
VTRRWCEHDCPKSNVQSPTSAKPS